MAERKRCYVVEAHYVEGAEEKRAPHREEHLARLDELRREGLVTVAGAFEDLSSSLLVFEVDSEQAAADLVRADPYWRAGLWTDFTVRAYNRVV